MHHNCTQAYITQTHTGVQSLHHTDIQESKANITLEYTSKENTTLAHIGEHNARNIHTFRREKREVSVEVVVFPRA